VKRHAWKHERWDYEPDMSRSPKRFARPRSRQWREAQWPSPESATKAGAIAAMKRLWSSAPQRIFEKPEWARVALKFGWMTRNQFLTVPSYDTGRVTPSIDEVLYRKMPLLGVVPK